MTKEGLLKRLRDIEWEDFEMKEAKGGIPIDVGEGQCFLKHCRRLVIARHLSATHLPYAGARNHLGKLSAHNAQIT